MAPSENFLLDVHLSIAQALSLLVFQNARVFFLLVRNPRHIIPLSPPRGRGGRFSESQDGKRIASSS